MPRPTTQLGLALCQPEPIPGSGQGLQRGHPPPAPVEPGPGQPGRGLHENGPFPGGPGRLPGSGAPAAPMTPRPTTIWGWPWANSKRDQEALGEFTQAVKLQTLTMARAHRNLGLAYLNLNRLDEARKGPAGGSAPWTPRTPRPIMPCASITPGPGTPRPPTRNLRRSRTWIRTWPRS